MPVCLHAFIPSTPNPNPNPNPNPTQEDHILKVNDRITACYYKDKKCPVGCSTYKGHYYDAKVLVLPADYKTKGVTVMYDEEGSPIEEGVLTSSIKVLLQVDGLPV